MIIPNQPQDNMLANSPQLMRAIIACLNQLLPEAPPNENPSLFNLRGPPTITIADYLARMFKYMNCSLSTFVCSLVLLDRVQEYHVGLVLHRGNIHRLLLAATVVAAKYMDDFFYKNSFYANVGGVHVTVLNILELQFLALINFNCHVEQETFENYLERLQVFAFVNEPHEGEKQSHELERITNQKGAAIVRRERTSGNRVARDESAGKAGKEKRVMVVADCATTVKQ